MNLLDQDIKEEKVWNNLSNLNKEIRKVNRILKPKVDVLVRINDNGILSPAQPLFGKEENKLDSLIVVDIPYNVGI